MRSAGIRALFLAASMVGALWACAPAVAGAAIDQTLVQRGAYLAKLGDCSACHTARGGKFMAGGLAFKTAMGTVYSTNITPDRQTGIGAYTLAQFRRALRRGVAADGHNLYPAMPYPSFAKVTNDDVRALYAYFMKGVAPVHQADKPSEMRFPYNIRFVMKIWNFLFLDTKPFVPDPTKDASWNRGAYIVEGLGHCGACHTPRGFAMQEKAMSNRGDDYLAGSTLAPWRAISLRHLTSEDAVVQMLKTGATDRNMAYGPMTEVIHYSTQHFTDADLRAIAHYLTSLAPAGTKPPAPAPVDEKALYGTRGGLAYVQFCGACHRSDGLGAEKIFPSLASNRAVLSDDPTSVIHVVLSGWTAAKTAGAPHLFSMPSFAPLGDKEIAEILTFMRASWGNKSPAVTTAQVKAMRKALALPPPAPKTPFTPRLADLLTAPDSSQLIYGLRLMDDTKKLMPHYVGDVLTCSSCHLNVGTVAKASPLWGLTPLFPTYNKRAGRVISMEDRLSGCFQRSMNGRPVPANSKEMKAMIAFMTWLKAPKGPNGKVPGRGLAKIDRSLKPDPARGKKLFKANCAVCHGENGDGAKNAKGEREFPPLWGDASYNIAAGMARTYTAAAFIKANMPVAHTAKFPQNQGGLSDQDAVDIAAYFSHQPRPDFAGKVNDWPKGGKPADARY